MHCLFTPNIPKWVDDIRTYMFSYLCNTDMCMCIYIYIYSYSVYIYNMYIFLCLYLNLHVFGAQGHGSQCRERWADAASVCTAVLNEGPDAKAVELM